MMLSHYLLVILSITSVAVALSPALLLSPYIKQNHIEEARKASTVDPSLFLNISSHAGYITVNEKQNSNLYFWYFPVAEKPVNVTPWIIWLQGGPGASSLVGLFDEVGPFEYDGELKLRQWSWGKNYSLLFIDNPVGAGYSFTDSNDGYVQNMTTCSEHLYSFIQQFLTIFPELRAAPLYIAGESYAGRYIPAIGNRIIQEKPSGNMSLNLQGLILGNPVLDRSDIANLTGVYYNKGLLDTQGVLAMKTLQEQYSKAIKDQDNQAAYDLRDKLLTRLEEITQKGESYNVLKSEGSLNKFEYFIKQPYVSEALHVGSIKFMLSNITVHTQLIPDFAAQAQAEVEKLLDQYNVMIYCGQLDLTAPCVPNAEARRRWHWKGRDAFLNAPRVPWTYNGTLVGYVKNGGGLSEVLVQKASNAARDQPSALHDLVYHFIDDKLKNITVADKYVNKDDYTPKIVIPDDIVIPPKPNTQERNGPLIASVVINVVLVISLVSGIFLYLRWKRRNDAYFYSTVDVDSISEGILTMT